MTRKRYGPNSTLPLPSKPMRKFNPKKRAQRVADDLVYGSHHRAIGRFFPCDLEGHPLHTCGSVGRKNEIEGHHLVGVGVGGEDRNNEVPLCQVGHDEMHACGSTSAACEKFGRDFRSAACEYTKEIDRRGFAEVCAEEGEQDE